MPHLTLNLHRTAAPLVVASALAGGVLLAPVAQAAGDVTVDAGGKGAVIDSTYSTILKVRGTGFQSVKGGHGGVYVWFGTVNGKWKPSAGGKSGVNYVYVPDSEAKDNAGFQKYVAFPGSNTASAANGGTMNAAGNWSTDMVVPGPQFEAVGRNGGITTVDCRKVTCGVITIGAHGVRNPNNETFTPVKLADLQRSGATGSSTGGSAAPAPSAAPSGAASAGPSTTTDTTPAKAVKPSLAVDHASAVAGRAMSFTASGLTAGEQFTLVLDDGLAAVGPFSVPDSGTASGVLSLPVGLSAGTHEIRVFGVSQDVAMKFGVAAAEAAASAAQSEADAERPVLAWTFAGLAALVFLAAVGVVARRTWRGRRAQA